MIRFAAAAALLLAACVIGLVVIRQQFGAKESPLLVMNARTEPVIAQLAAISADAWMIPPGGWGPYVEEANGTKVWFYTAGCGLIGQDTIGTDAFSSLIVLTADGIIQHASGGDLPAENSTRHRGCPSAVSASPSE